MTIPQQRIDRRTQRTRQAIQQAFRELVQEKGFTAASIREISERADVNRGTFYGERVSRRRARSDRCHVVHASGCDRRPVAAFDLTRA